MKKFYLLFFLFIMLFLGSSRAQQPELVADINNLLSQSISSSSQRLTSTNGKLFFRNLINNSVELGVFDGTNIEAFDLLESGNSEPDEFTTIGSTVYFSAREPEAGGRELYQYLNGVITLIDVNPSGTSNPESLIEYNGELYFSAENDTNGRELWKYDGTTATMIDIRPGTDSSDPEDLIVYNAELLFYADNGAVGKELWKYNGTDASLVEDIRSGAIGSNNGSSRYFTELNGVLYFSASDGSGAELWRYDGTSVTNAADINASGGSNPRDLTVFSSTLYFRAYGSAVESDELWQFDGTTASLVADIYPGSESSQVQDLIATENYLYFEARDGVSEKDLYKYDGTTITSIDVNPDNSDAGGQAFIDYILAVGNTIYFQAKGSSASGTELWKYDGTTLTEIVIRPGSGSSSPRYMTELNGEIYFFANAGVGANGWNLWKYDGIEASPINISGETEGSGIYELTGDENNLYFNATEDNIRDDLFFFDGTTATKVSDITSPVGDENYELTSFMGKLVYASYFEDNSSIDLYVFDGSSIESFDIRIGGDANPSELTVLGDILYFIARDDDGYKIHQYDGTNVSVAYDLVGQGIGQARDLEALGSNIYFTAQTAAEGRELFKFDGSTVTIVEDITPGSGSTNNITSLTLMIDDLYFTASTPQGNELCKYDGTSFEIIDVNPGSGSSNPAFLTVINDEIVFSADDGSNGIELWSYDGSSINLIEIRTGSESSNPREITELNGILYFRAFTDEAGNELFKYDGTSASLAVDINEGSGSSIPSNLFVHGPYIYFSATNFTGGGPAAEANFDISPLSNEVLNEDENSGLWRYDGTSLTFISSFEYDGDEPMVFRENYVYLTGDNGETGLELYRIRAISEEARILTFSLPGQTSNTFISVPNKTIDLTVAPGTDVTNLTPTIFSISELATVDLSGPQDFTNPVVYTVTSEYGNSIEWTVNVSVEFFTGTDILSFSFEEETSTASIDDIAHTISIEVQAGTDITNLTPSISASQGASVSPIGAQDFTNSITYTVTAENGDAQDWTLTVSVANSAPIVANSFPDAFSSEEGFGSTQVNYAEVFSDPDGDELTISVSSSNESVVTTSLIANSQIQINETGVGVSTITVTATDGDGEMVSDSFTFTVTEAPLGFEDELAIEVYPNPVTDFININSKEQITIYLTDMKGQSIKSDAGRSIQMNLSELGLGVYILRITNGESSAYKKIIKAN